MKTLVIALLFVAGLAAGALWWRQTYNYDRDFGNQEFIAKAYLSFYRDTGKLPLSLNELVASKYLPEDGEFFREPKRLFRSTISYNESCYQVLPIKPQDASALRILARSRNDGSLDFNPTVNAIIRDGINAKKWQEELLKVLVRTAAARPGL